MKTYISILRGINVSGQKLMKMDALKKMHEKLGFKDVKTYVQSGNVIFKSKEKKIIDLEQTISKQLKKNFDFDVPVIVLTTDKLKKIIEGNSFWNDKTKEPSSLYVTLLASGPGDYDEEIIKSRKSDVEDIILTNDAVYLYCPKGYGNTKLNNNFLERKLKVVATTRNWKTMNELLRIAEEM